MATPTSFHRSFFARPFFAHPVGRLLIVTCALLVGAAVAPTSASADPEPLPDTASEAAQEVSELERNLEILSEQRNDAQVALDRHIAEAAAATVALGQVNMTMTEIDGRVRRVARSAFAGDRLGSLSALFTSGSPQEFLDRVNTLEYMSGRDGALLAEATDIQAEAKALNETADAAVASAQATVADIAARTDELESRIETYQTLFAQLSAAEQALFNDGPEGDSRGGPEGDSGDGSGSGSGQAPPGPILAPTEAARIAVESAYAQLGDRYVWGGAGPDVFDCSGLTSYVYAQAGVNLPHSSNAQSTMGIPVSRSELQPGDLIFYYSPISHVAIYVGDGQIIHAYSPSSPVSLDPVDPWGAYNSARRITG